MDDESIVYTSQKVMNILHLSKDTFWQLVHSGTIPCIKVSERKYLFPKSQIDKWLAGEQIHVHKG